ncbi:tripartite tricarboxylate transporter substrate binding protein [Ramlibacter sp. AW1]|uniref:Tripartite tricarboxylate transporter substrate binding protein n=1 Tax=Ramlibacter aurantiacus TaxID=2801330 RepID=A0A936ZI81_9BURK|nr:tripartite tricarboxylate transporter substrate binding protein [Ramlibacter aurantiacus]MBL0420703.1 tripartite tricarboxylate transporter substrate binding protein [Ramlibacter aurantiacus]
MPALTPRLLPRALQLALAASCVAAALPSQADPAYPSRAIRIIVPWTPGAPADAATRIVAERMSASMKQPVVVENRPGASGTIGYAEALRQPADGYTVYVLSSASLVLPLLYPSRKLEFTRELDPVGHLHWSYNALVVNADSKLTSLNDIVSRAKAEPGKVSFASAGNGTPAHLAGESYSRYANVRTAHVPYVQFPMAINDLLGGRIDFMFMTTVSAIPQVNGGKMRALAVTSAKRLPALPNVPTMTELGVPNFVFRSFETVAVKAGTPKAIADRLNKELNQALASPEVREQFTANGWDIEPMSREQITQVLASESERWLALGRDLQIKAD